MGDHDAIESGCAVPVLGTKKSLRYEVDDFIVSPPSNEDGGFFHLRYGQRSTNRSSTYDRINEELSMTVEVKDGDPLISDINLSGLNKNTVAPHLNISAGGISPSTEPSSSSHVTKPLFVFHLKNSKSTGAIKDNKEPGEGSDPSCMSPEADTDLLNYSPLEFSPVSDSEKRIDKADHRTVDQPKREFIKPDKKLDFGLLEKVQNLKVISPTESPLSPHTTPLTTPQSSPGPRRKISGRLMDPSAVHSYFCTKPFQGSQGSQQSNASSFTQDDGRGAEGLSVTSMQMTDQMDNASKVSINMEPGSFIGKKRRPKPSALREMNFWAPTSM